MLFLSGGQSYNSFPRRSYRHPRLLFFFPRRPCFASPSFPPPILPLLVVAARPLVLSLVTRLDKSLPLLLFELTLPVVAATVDDNLLRLLLDILELFLLLLLCCCCCCRSLVRLLRSSNIWRMPSVSCQWWIKSGGKNRKCHR